MNRNGLEWKHLRMEQLDRSHLDDLVTVSMETDFTWMSRPLFCKDDVARYIENSISKANEDSGEMFVIRLNRSSEIVGITGFLEIDRWHRKFEIGGTWLSRKVWGTFVNPESKFILLKLAFDEWNATRIQFVTDENNVHSANAILKLGATFEGILRHHKIRLNGLPRNSMIFSIIENEWPRVKRDLLERLNSFEE